MSELSWYAVQTKPRQEERVHGWLRARSGLSVFLPKVADLRRRRSRRVKVVEPLFPSYLFVQMRLEPEDWYAVKWAPGVKGIVATGDVPTPVPAEAIGMLRGRCEDGEIIPLDAGWRLKAGSTVQVVHGPFSGLEGILERQASRGERVRVLLQLMGCLTPVEMDVTDVELVA
ncbi:MAG TPA: transcription termination/antitermination NusG family protein [bacterium]|nr:transcription termination/antitermination NusG family protein [bacterium]